MTLQKASSLEKINRIKLEDAIKRNYPIITFIEKKYNRKHCRLNLPICFDNCIVKLSLVKSNKKSKDDIIRGLQKENKMLIQKLNKSQG